MDWPFTDLRLRCRDVELRGVTDADLPRLVEIFPDDCEIDPRAERFSELDPVRDVARLVLQGVWAHRGRWSPRSWCLDLAVVVDGTVVGLQALEGDDFPLLRTVDSYSWLARQARGRGTATAMRAAVLSLAFGPLGAVAAVSSARAANAPSLAVSRRLGYVPNGVSLTNTPTGVAELHHVRLTRERWSGDVHPVEISGVEPCLPWFGLAGG